MNDITFRGQGIMLPIILEDFDILAVDTKDGFIQMVSTSLVIRQTFKKQYFIHSCETVMV
jgi:hypothetical protein